MQSRTAWTIGIVMGPVLVAAQQFLPAPPGTVDPNTENARGPVEVVVIDKIERPTLSGPSIISRMKLSTLLAVAALVASTAIADAQTMSYGTPITAETAKKIAAPALAEAKKNNWNMAVAIVDPSGDLVYFEKMDDTQVGSVDVAISKARSAARFKRPTKAFQDALAAGGEGLRILALDGAIPVDGGVPLVSGGKIVGAIGVSGGTSAQDGQVAAAGVAALK